MTRLLDILHNRLGDFWWYSLMIFCACRVADVLNMFVGLYLVPKYVDAKELGAVIPLSSFATTLALPAYIFAMTFMKELNTLATRRDFGRMKSLMQGVFLVTAILLIVAIVVSRLLMPVFLEKIRIVEGSLGFLILASAFVGCVAPIYTNALQALKRFRAISLMHIVGAPLRLVAMLVAMPFRPLSAYFVGQGATPAFQIAASVWLLRKELRVKAERYWSMPVFRRFALLFLGMAGYQLASMLNGLVEMTVMREGLPDVQSAAYYMMTRFSDITSFVTGTLIVVLFPMTAELAEQGKDTRPLVLKASLAQIVFGLVLGLFFFVFGRQIVSLLPHGSEYAEFFWLIPWMIGINTLSSLQCFYVNTEASAGRFKFLWYWIPLHLAFMAYLTFFPVKSLWELTMYFLVTNVIRLIFAGVGIWRR